MPSFEVTAPDGAKYQVDAPEGASQQDAIEFVAMQHYPDVYRAAQQPQPPPAPPKPLDPNEGQTETYFDIPSMSFKQRPGNFTEALGGGMERFVRGAGNLAMKGYDKLTGQSGQNLSDLVTGGPSTHGGFFSDAALAAQDKMDKPLEAADPFGYGVGEAAPTLPISEAASGLEGLKALPLVGRMLGSPLARAPVEGAFDAAAVAPGDDQGAAAGTGAAIGAGLTGAFGAAGRIARGLVQKSGAAQDLQNLASQSGKDLFVPVTQAADADGDVVTRAAKSIYKDVLPIAPGVSGQLNRQSGRAMDTVREMALDAADPTGTTVQAGAGQDPVGTISDLKDAFDQEYQDTVKNYVFDVPEDFRDQVETRIKAAVPDVDDKTLESVTSAIDDHMDRFASGKSTIDGGNLLNAKNATSALAKTMRGPEKAALTAGKGVFDDIISDELSTNVSPSAKDDLARYQSLNDPYSAFTDVSKAVNKAQVNGGQFNPRQLASSVKPGRPLYPLAQAAQGTLGQPAVSTSPFGLPRLGRLLTLGEGVHELPWVLGHLPAVGAGIGGANLLATQTVQKALMGDTAAQVAIGKLLEAHPESAAMIQTVIRNAATTQAGR